MVLYSQEQKPKKRWRFVFPLKRKRIRLNSSRGSLFRLEDLKALEIIDPGPRAHGQNSAPHPKPKVKVTIHASGTDQTVKIYQPDPSSGEAFAEPGPHGPSCTRSAPTAIKDLTKDLFALQDKRLLGTEVAQIAYCFPFKTRDQQYASIHQNPDEWLLEDRPTKRVSQEHADLFVSRVVNLPAEERGPQATRSPDSLWIGSASRRICSERGRTARLWGN